MKPCPSSIELLVVIAFAFANSPALAGYYKGEDGRLYQMISVVSPKGAKCSYVRDNITIATVNLGGGEEGELRLGQAPVDVTDSHDDILIACELDGYESQSKVILWGKQRILWSSAPCTYPPRVSEQEFRACMNRPEQGWTTPQYPEGVQLRLVRKAAH